VSRDWRLFLADIGELKIGKVSRLMNVEPTMNDEILDEVRAIREAHAARFHYDLQAIAEDLLRTEREWPGPKIDPRPRSPRGRPSTERANPQHGDDRLARKGP
jgi:hypothetical protein